MLVISVPQAAVYASVLTPADVKLVSLNAALASVNTELATDRAVLSLTIAEYSACPKGVLLAERISSGMRVSAVE
jgi:hypothetical protein